MICSRLRIFILFYLAILRFKLRARQVLLPLGPFCQPFLFFVVQDRVS
jgi:hypothetical protein